MGTFRLGHSSQQAHEENRRIIAKITTTIHTGARITVAGSDPADTRTLRGIPAIGKGIAGVSPGTRPDQIADDNRDAA